MMKNKTSLDDSLILFDEEASTISRAKRRACYEQLLKRKIKCNPPSVHVYVERWQKDAHKRLRACYKQLLEEFDGK
jgi:hypothetical protein